MNHSASETAYKGLAQAYDRTNNKMVFDSKLYGSTDNGTTWNTVKTDASGNVNVVGTVGIATSSNTVKLDQTLSNNTVKIDSSTNVVKSNLYAGVTPTTLTTTLNGVAQSLDCNISNGSFTISGLNNSFNPTGSITGLNMYQIYPKRKTLIFGGINTSALAGQLVGYYNQFLATDNDFGLSRPKYWFAYNSGTGLNVVLTYYYVTTSGEEGFNSVNVNNNAWSVVFTTSATHGSSNSTIVAINNFTIGIQGSTSSSGSITNGSITINFTSTNSTPGSQIGALSGTSSAYQFNSLLVCPNNAIMWVNSMNFSSSAADYPRLMKWSASNGSRSIMWLQNGASSGSYSAPDPYSGLGGYITPGEAMAFARAGSTSSSIVISASVIVQYF